jgi:hypothetical protein
MITLFPGPFFDEALLRFIVFFFRTNAFIYCRPAANSGAPAFAPLPRNQKGRKHHLYQMLLNFPAFLQ